jgi:hypothetical protein
LINKKKVRDRRQASVGNAAVFLGFVSATWAKLPWYLAQRPRWILLPLGILPRFWRLDDCRLVAEFA